ncbi:ArpU family transcriptional regulator [Paenibacillus sp. N1-5-1-14]|uniref:ArpU family phage packaging/lysis transcriptional regulator n=1 Tax=Paenibacillus radicibacter TaxID=2972488 RepID=UPI002158A729|nr:ArpU family phage packaging/lysis transcriptional regulator [Paenibacillus radicibacter]MCR8645561.1 ArpU family transcriptional regulator [Paenibacillus radicibacter]
MSQKRGDDLGSLLFQLIGIDKAATRKKVEEVLESARIYRQIGFIRKEIQTTRSYEARYHSDTHSINKATENVAISNVDDEERLRYWTENVERAVQQLNTKERDVIEKRYLEPDREYDFLLCHELGVSERTYRRIKSHAIAKLAFMLSLEVSKDEHEPEKYKKENACMMATK